MTDSNLQLLARYARDHVEDAFAEIVRRHLDLVYSAALRQVRSPQLAEEIAQSAFIDLARNAHRLGQDTILTAWLYQVTRRTAIDVVRREARRQLREQIATEMNVMNATADDWAHVAPLLDDAMSALDPTDRAAILLRYFENKSLREVGMALGTSDDAAQKRVSRAVERLREFFAKRRVPVGVGGLAAVIAANAVQAAPLGLAVTISTAAGIAGTTITSAATATKFIAMTTLQKTLITATIVVASAATPWVIQHQSRVKLRDENARLQQQVGQLSTLTAENVRLSNLVARGTPTQQPEPLNDLLRLRGEVAALRKQTNELRKLRAEIRRLQEAPPAAMHQIGFSDLPPASVGQVELPRESWTFSGYTNPESAILSLAAAAVSGDVETFLNSLSPDERARQLQEWQREGKSGVQIRDGLVKEFGPTESIRILDQEKRSDNEIILTLLVDYGGGRTESPMMKVQRFGNEWKMAGRYEPPVRTTP